MRRGRREVENSDMTFGEGGLGGLANEEEAREEEALNDPHRIVEAGARFEAEEERKEGRRPERKWMDALHRVTRRGPDAPH